MTLQLFRELRQDIETLKAERDLIEVHLGVTQYRLLELIGGLKALNDMLLIRPVTSKVFKETEALVNRMVAMAKRDYDALKADEKAVADLRKATGDD